MNHNLQVAETVLIKADVKKVWDALTNPEKIKAYLYGTETITDWKVGSPIVFQGEYQGQKHKDKGVVLENKPLELLSYSYWSGMMGLEEKPENYSKIIYTLKKVDDTSTEFTWTQIGFSSEKGYDHTKNGMKEFLNTLKTVAER